MPDPTTPTTDHWPGATHGMPAPPGWQQGQEPGQETGRTQPALPSPVGWAPRPDQPAPKKPSKWVPLLVAVALVAFARGAWAHKNPNGRRFIVQDTSAFRFTYRSTRLVYYEMML